jgi:hypothetical protein
MVFVVAASAAEVNTSIGWFILEPVSLSMHRKFTCLKLKFPFTSPTAEVHFVPSHWRARLLVVKKRCRNTTWLNIAFR